ncbi:helix-turn-helix domain-containing protein [Haladaptatus caseinilyticus]|uniref:helix-turn-helix domain-containing protein n=1 Tax=Haladaptatus caseinilyticus TaxID=2993314 RepID=UPI00224B2456|nr:helix-turn-helix domain-containing protein [Haladaptatus caseinilyticus]
MTIIAELTIPTDEVGLSDTFESIPGLIVELERMVVQPASRIMPYIWAVGSESTAVHRALQDDPTITTVTKLSELDGGSLYSVRWSEKTESTIEQVLKADPVILSGTAVRQGWDFQIRFDCPENLSTLQTNLNDRNVSVELKRLYAPEAPTVDGQFMLTSKQRIALMVALDAGYFDVPRKANLTELAEELDITPQALSKRLRRAHKTMSRYVITRNPKTTNRDTRLD